MPEYIITPATILLGLSTALLLFASIGSYVFFGNNEGNIIIVISLLFSGAATFAVATDMGSPYIRDPKSIFRGSISDTAAALTYGIMAFIIALLYAIVMLIPPTTNDMRILGYASSLASALSLVGAILAQRESDGSNLQLLC